MNVRRDFLVFVELRSKVVVVMLSNISCNICGCRRCSLICSWLSQTPISQSWGKKYLTPVLALLLTTMVECAEEIIG